MKSFIPNAAMVHTRSFGPPPPSDGDDAVHALRKIDDPIVLIDDEVVKISAILLRPTLSDGHELTKDEATELNASEFLQKSMENDSPELLKKSHSHKAELALKPGDLSVIYVCELPEIKGKFDPQKAAALGLRPGPKYRALQLGNSVKSDHQDIMVESYLECCLFFYGSYFFYLCIALRLFFRFIRPTSWALLFLVPLCSLLTAQHHPTCNS